MSGSCEYGNEHLVSIKSKECLDQLTDYHFLRKDSAPWSQLISKCNRFLCIISPICTEI